MNDQDWDRKFEQLMNEDLINLPENYFDEELKFSDPNELNEIFTLLEEKNLYFIHMSQDLEQAIEGQRQQYDYF